MHVRFINGGYNHTWPSRAVTHYPDGYEGTVKREVAEAAIAAGRAEKTKRSAGESSDVAEAAETQ